MPQGWREWQARWRETGIFFGERVVRIVDQADKFDWRWRHPLNLKSDRSLPLEKELDLLTRPCLRVPDFAAFLWNLLRRLSAAPCRPFCLTLIRPARYIEVVSANLSDPEIDRPGFSGAADLLRRRSYTQIWRSWCRVCSATLLPSYSWTFRRTWWSTPVPFGSTNLISWFLPSFEPTDEDKKLVPYLVISGAPAKSHSLPQWRRGLLIAAAIFIVGVVRRCLTSLEFLSVAIEGRKPRVMMAVLSFPVTSRNVVSHASSAVSYEALFQCLHQQYFPRCAFGPVYLSDRFSIG